MSKERLLFTGASGFLGKNILPSLSQKYDIETIGLSSGDTYKVDFSANIPDLRQQYDAVLHAAGKAHIIPTSEEERAEFFQVNLQGTKNLCTALERNGLPKSFIFISTVAVYGVVSGHYINEEHPLLGNTPYALSKIKAEEYLMTWCLENHVKLGILRPPLIAGTNPPGNLGAMVDGIKSGRYLSIEGGKAKKSILMAEDISRLLPEISKIGGIYNVCDDHHPSLMELEALIAAQLGKKHPLSIPFWLAKVLAITGDMTSEKFPVNSGKLDKIFRTLTFSNEKAKNYLNWMPLDVLSNFKIL